MDVGWFMLGVLLSLASGWGTVLCQLSAFYCRETEHRALRSPGSGVRVPWVPRMLHANLKQVPELGNTYLTRCVGHACLGTSDAYGTATL